MLGRGEHRGVGAHRLTHERDRTAPYLTDRMGTVFDERITRNVMRASFAITMPPLIKREDLIVIDEQLRASFPLASVASESMQQENRGAGAAVVAAGKPCPVSFEIQDAHVASNANPCRAPSVLQRIVYRMEMEVGAAKLSAGAVRDEANRFLRRVPLREVTAPGVPELTSSIPQRTMRSMSRDTHGEAPAATSVRIVRAGAERIADLRPLWESLLAHHAAVAPQLEGFGSVRAPADSWARRQALYVEWLAQPNAFVLIAEDRSTPVGYALVHMRGPDDTWATAQPIAELETLTVLANCRGHGIGTQLINAVHRELQAIGVVHLGVSVIASNADAVRFYERLGLTRYLVSYLSNVAPPAPDTKLVPPGAGGTEQTSSRSVETLHRVAARQNGVTRPGSRRATGTP